MIYALIGDLLIKSAANTIPVPTPTPIELPTNQIDEFENWRRSNSHCGKAIKIPNSRYPIVNTIGDSSSTISQTSLGISRMNRIVRNIKNGIEKIHKIEAGKNLRKAIHWARLMGIEMVRIDPKKPGADPK